MRGYGVIVVGRRKRGLELDTREGLEIVCVILGCL